MDFPFKGETNPTGVCALHFSFYRFARVLAIAHHLPRGPVLSILADPIRLRYAAARGKRGERTIRNVKSAFLLFRQSFIWTRMESGRRCELNVSKIEKISFWIYSGGLNRFPL
jgi:hypothetical protein